MLCCLLTYVFVCVYKSYGIISAPMSMLLGVECLSIPMNSQSKLSLTYYQYTTVLESFN